MVRRVATYRFFIQSVVSGDGITYQEAIDGCAKNNWVLATIPTPSQTELLRQIFEKNSGLRAAWIGLRAIGSAVQFDWSWPEGDPLDYEIISPSSQKFAEEKIMTEGKAGCIVLHLGNIHIIIGRDCTMTSH